MDAGATVFLEERFDTTRAQFSEQLPGLAHHRHFEACERMHDRTSL
jgi:hypothetical protein